MSLPVPPAELIKTESYRVKGGLKIIDRWFKVPLDYTVPKGEKITVFARSAVQNKNNDDGVAGAKAPYMLYLQGGPGFECGPPKNHPLTQFMLGKDYQMLYLDQRGTGLSSPISANFLARRRDTAQAQADYLKFFRADNIVRDAEAIRQTLLEDRETKTWSILGQSFGGFCAVTYLSFYPNSLREVFTTGGMPPLITNPENVYLKTYQQVAKRTQVYYGKYPQDRETMELLIQFVRGGDDEKLILPSGGRLSEMRLRGLGLAFGGHGGIDNVHRVLQRMGDEVREYGDLSWKAKQMFEEQQSFDGNPIYVLLHEACYCQGESSHWSADGSLEAFMLTLSPSDQETYFVGEMIYSSFLDDFTELRKLKSVADLLARYQDWPALYDEAQLARNTVPVYTANFIEDMYVDYELAKKTVAKIRGAKAFDTNVMYHNAVRSRNADIMAELWKLKVGEVD